MRLYLNQALSVGDTINLPPYTHHHVSTVRRHTSGDSIILFNNSDREYVGNFTLLSKKQSTVTIISDRAGLKPSPLHCHLGIGISTGSRFDLAIQKATELGVSEITPLLTEKSVRHKHSDKKQHHWEQITISASEQSGRCNIPIFHRPSTLEDWLQNRDEEQKLISSLQKNSLSLSTLSKPTSLALLIGPASGLTDKEELIAREHHFQGLSLGPRTLRTETACLTAMSLVQFMWGDSNENV